MKNKLVLFIIGILICSCHFKKTNDTKEVNALHTIPFTLTKHNNLSIKALINKIDTVDLMFHTAANTLDMTKKAAENMTSINWDTETEVNTWGGTAASRSSENNTLAIGNLKWDGVRIWENENSGPNTDGKFGPNFFAGQTVEINYDKLEITLHATVPNYHIDYVKVPLILENDLMFIECQSIIEGNNYPNRFLIHSGFGGTVLYDDAFVAKSEIGKRIKINSQQELKDSHGNILTTSKGEIPLFTIGAFEFEDMPIGFFEGTIGRQKISVLGGDLLRRFNIIIDEQRNFIYIQPSELMHSAYSTI